MEIQARLYFALTKPGIIGGNLVTAVAGFFVASHRIQAGPLLAMMIGLSCIIGSACAFNNVIDRMADQKMVRTQRRPLATGALSMRDALIFATVLGVVGVTILARWTNLMTVVVATAGLFFYVVPYSLMKYRTCYATWIGGISGAIPPVVGYAAVHPQLDLLALLLFTVVFFWQIPHFLAIALYRQNDYKAASIPIYPLVKGGSATRWQMVIYTLAFGVAATSLAWLGFAGNLYLGVSLALSLGWLVIAVRGWKTTDLSKWARQMFIFSLVVITLLSLVLCLND